MKKVFFIMPFGKKQYINLNSETFKPIETDHDKYYRKLKRKIENLGGFKVFRNDDALNNDILRTMFLRIKKADIVFVDLSFYNTNVVYELGLRHAWKWNSTILFSTEDKAKFPFNIDKVYISSYEELLRDLKKLLYSKGQSSNPLALINGPRSTKKYIWDQKTEVEDEDNSPRPTEIVESWTTLPSSEKDLFLFLKKLEKYSVDFCKIAKFNQIKAFTLYREADALFLKHYKDWRKIPSKDDSEAKYEEWWSLCHKEWKEWQERWDSRRIPELEVFKNEIRNKTNQWLLYLWQLCWELLEKRISFLKKIDDLSKEENKYENKYENLYNKEELQNMKQELENMKQELEDMKQELENKIWELQRSNDYLKNHRYFELEDWYLDKWRRFFSYLLNRITVRKWEQTFRKIIKTLTLKHAHDWPVHRREKRLDEVNLGEKLIKNLERYCSKLEELSKSIEESRNEANTKLEKYQKEHGQLEDKQKDRKSNQKNRFNDWCKEWEKQKKGQGDKDYYQSFQEYLILPYIKELLEIVSRNDDAVLKSNPETTGLISFFLGKVYEMEGEKKKVEVNMALEYANHCLVSCFDIYGLSSYLLFYIIKYEQEELKYEILLHEARKLRKKVVIMNESDSIELDDLIGIIDYLITEDETNRVEFRDKQFVDPIIMKIDRIKEKNRQKL